MPLVCLTNWVDVSNKSYYLVLVTYPKGEGLKYCNFQREIDSEAE